MTLILKESGEGGGAGYFKWIKLDIFFHLTFNNKYKSIVLSTYHNKYKIYFY